MKQQQISRPLATEKEARILFICITLMSVLFALMIGIMNMTTNWILIIFYFTLGIPLVIGGAVFALLALIFRPTTTHRRAAEGALLGTVLSALAVLGEILALSGDALPVVLGGAFIGALAGIVASWIRRPKSSSPEVAD